MSKKSISFTAAAALILIWPATLLSSTEVSESQIIVDTTWTKAGSPYIIKDHLHVLEGATLTIEPGVIIKFLNHRPESLLLNVDGRLLARGEENNPIYMISADQKSGARATNNRTWQMWIYASGSVLNYVTAIGTDGIGIYGASTSINHLTIEDSRSGLWIADGNYTISNFRANNIYSYALQLREGNFQLIDSQISNISYGSGIYLYTADLIMKHTLIEKIGLAAPVGNIFSESNGVTLHSSRILVDSSVLRIGSTFGMLFIDDPFPGISPSSGEIIHSQISDFLIGGIKNQSKNEILAAGNWWGDPSGPFHPIQNPLGLGNAVSDNVIFIPWLKTPPHYF